MRSLLLFLPLAVGVPDREPPQTVERPKSIREQLVGHWRLVSMSYGEGVEVESNLERRQVQFTDAELRVCINGEWKISDGADYALDDSRSPVAIDVTPRNRVEKKMAGILKIDGDILTLSLALDGERPNNFVPSTQSLQVLMQFKCISRQGSP